MDHNFSVSSGIEFVILLLLYSCASDCLGRRLGPRLLGRVDDSGVNNFFSRCCNFFIFFPDIIFKF